MSRSHVKHYSIAFKSKNGFDWVNAKRDVVDKVDRCIPSRGGWGVKVSIVAFYLSRLSAQSRALARLANEFARLPDYGLTML